MELNCYWHASATTYSDLNPEDYLDCDTEEEVTDAISGLIEEPSFPYLGDDMEAYIDCFNEIEPENLKDFLFQWKLLKQDGNN